MSQDAILEVEALSVAYGPVSALRNISFTIKAGEIVALVGSNGAGKTSALKAITGLEKTASGNIRFCGSNIASLPTPQIIRKGISMSPEGRRVFPNMTVHENLLVGSHSRKEKGEREARLSQVYRRFPRLA